MRKLLILVGVLVVVHVALLFIRLPNAAQAASDKTLNVGIVLDVGGLGDKSFNDGAYRGAQLAEKELGAKIRLIEPGESSDREAGLRLLAAEHMDLVIGVGFIFTDDVRAAAARFPGVKFAGIDYSPSPGVGTLPNLAGLRFREQEGSFLVGAIAALTSKTKIVGFVGGMKIPLIRKFEAGYEAGVAYVCRECRVLSAYAGTEPKAFADPSTGEALATAQYDKGADVIFHAAGKTGDGVFAAAKHAGGKAIGVDSDQYDAAPCCVMTSMVKGVDVAVLDVIKEVAAGRFRPGIHELGLAENGVGFVSDARNRAMLPPEVVERVRGIGQDIVAGKIQVPDR